ncbi:MAG: adenine phosphoribosyltransferase [Candidatus Sungbacteria bacterium]|uniref:Adenine phosphoribosyltransferase n=1 Tax=Candidatus Sungiibacteriota bacterium TaxID=2750080 RepID=A0A931SCS4_9BACT|nr:adenine phosphoribosyltransferase [Candidatus Sungbacteria bacterium]
MSTYSSYREVFPKKHTLLVVVHVADANQALSQVNIARRAGADGAFLINHDEEKVPALALSRIYQSIRKVHPDWWLGLNFLDLNYFQAFARVPENASGLWTDDAGLDESLSDTAANTRVAWKFRQNGKRNWPGLYFGGVAFKYQREVTDYMAMVRAAKPYMDVVTTSGPATGEPPAVEKIRAMHEALGDHPLAIASGITPENVGQYLGLTDCFLVATGVSKDFHELDEKKVKVLAAKIRV